jgi:hypothetical protein
VVKRHVVVGNPATIKTILRVERAFIVGHSNTRFNSGWQIFCIHQGIPSVRVRFKLRKRPLKKRWLYLGQSREEPVLAVLQYIGPFMAIFVYILLQIPPLKFRTLHPFAPGAFGEAPIDLCLTGTRCVVVVVVCIGVAVQARSIVTDSFH